MPTMSRSRLKPTLTPRTALATRARVSPCRARLRRSSPARAKVTIPPSTLQVIPGGSACVSEAFPFSTITDPPALLTLTPAGIGIGCLPILDTFLSSPDRADDFAARARLAGLAPAHHSPRRRHDGDSQPAEHLRDPLMAAVDALPGPADAFDPGEVR